MWYSNKFAKFRPPTDTYTDAKPVAKIFSCELKIQLTTLTHVLIRWCMWPGVDREERHNNHSKAGWTLKSNLTHTSSRKRGICVYCLLWRDASLLIHTYAQIKIKSISNDGFILPTWADWPTGCVRDVEDHGFSIFPIFLLLSMFVFLLSLQDCSAIYLSKVTRCYPTVSSAFNMSRLSVLFVYRHIKSSRVI